MSEWAPGLDAVMAYAQLEHHTALGRQLSRAVPPQLNARLCSQNGNSISQLLEALVGSHVRIAPTQSSSASTSHLTSTPVVFLDHSVLFIEAGCLTEP